MGHRVRLTTKERNRIREALGLAALSATDVSDSATDAQPQDIGPASDVSARSGE